MRYRPARTTLTTSQYPASTTTSQLPDPTSWIRPTITGRRSTQSTPLQHLDLLRERERGFDSNPIGYDGSRRIPGGPIVEHGKSSLFSATRVD